MSFPYRNCVFDLYGTLVDIHTDEEQPSLWSDFAVFLAGMGVAYAPDALRACYLRLCREESARCAARLQAHGIPGPEEIDLLSVWRSLGDLAGLQITDTQAREISRWFRCRTTIRLRLFPGAADTLETLHRLGCRVWLLTNAQESFTLPELASLGLLKAFDHILISSSFGVRKPSPAFFGQLLAGGEDPSDFLMVGNDDGCDCRGAAQVGMDSLYIATEQSPPRCESLPRSCMEIADLREIPALSGRISGI
ncbi:MAG: HAD family hydrolase [Clostridia bacterium]|nr:HAD family hydrolase [Clostridia bacterium]